MFTSNGPENKISPYVAIPSGMSRGEIVYSGYGCEFESRKWFRKAKNSKPKGKKFNRKALREFLGKCFPYLYDFDFVRN